MDMLDVLNDARLFRERFCAPSTISNLAGINPERLREVLIRIHQVCDFDAAASPELWTPEPSPQPVVVIGCMGSNGKVIMNAPRFGLCTNAGAAATRGATALYLWVDHRALDLLDEKSRGAPQGAHPWNWRSGESGKADPVQRFYRVPTALYSEAGGHADLSEVQHAGAGSDLRTLLAGLGALLTPPDPRGSAVRAVTPHARLLELDPGVYTPTAISAFNATVPARRRTR